MILDMDLLLSSHNLSIGTKRELFWFKDKYHQLLKERKHFDQNHLNYALDQICARRNLPLDDSPWTGEAPIFSNDQYTVDLMTGEVSQRASKAIISALPQKFTLDPLFSKNFPGLVGKEIPTLTEQLPDGTQVIFFEDDEGNAHRIEEKEERYTFYRAFPKADHPELLQAASFNREGDNAAIQQLFEAALATEDRKEAAKSFFAGIKALLFKGTKPKPPAILDHRLFIDPHNAKKGYIFDKQDNLLFAVTFSRSLTGTRSIESITDLRKGRASEPKRLLGLSQLGSTPLKTLEQFEDPSHILLWGDTKGGLEKIELPRYGLEFAYNKGALTCLTPGLTGYQIRLASLEERQGFAFSLLLEYPDRSRPKKLLLPPTDAIVEGAEKKPPHFGLAYIIWLIKSALSPLADLFIPESLLHPRIDETKASLSYTTVDLQSHTEEILYQPKKELVQRQELLLQAIKLGDDRLALRLLDTLKLEENDPQLREWIYFIKGLQQNGHAAAIGLKLSEKIDPCIEGNPHYEKIIDSYYRTKSQLLTPYLKELKNLPKPLRLNPESFAKIALFMRDKDQTTFRKEIAPFFLNVGDLCHLPVIHTDGSIADLPEVMPTPEVQRRKKLSEMSQLEAEIQPNTALDPASLTRTLTKPEVPQSILFDLSEVEMKDKKSLLTKIIRPKLKAFTERKAQVKEAIKAALLYSTDASDQIALFANAKMAPSLPDLHLALLQNDFASLQLPKGTDIEALKGILVEFYDLEIRTYLLSRCEEELTSAIRENTPVPASLHGLLTHKRNYDPVAHPELLAFEAFGFLTFRDSAPATQLELLQKLLESISSIIQAGTGTGKSSVLGPLRTLMRANGSNLVSYKVLPHLLGEAWAIFEKILGRVHKRKLMLFLFNLAMPLNDQEGKSIFEGFYHQFLSTIKNKGAVLSDYKSYVLLEQKFYAVSKMIAGYRDDGHTSSPFLITHWFYLLKTLILLKNRNDELMDEFDQPMNPLQRIQTQVKEGQDFEEWMVDAALHLFEHLKEDGALMLSENLQGDILEENRKKVIHRVAVRLSNEFPDKTVPSALIYRYLIGEDEEVLSHLQGWSETEKDQLAFFKDQCTLYLTITLDRSGSTDYGRSEDGKNIITCAKGERRVSKFGNQTEEINYTIQDYFQQKVALPTLKERQKRLGARSPIGTKTLRTALP
jgi:hypothetical protein